jgi:hypothetical protein
VTEGEEPGPVPERGLVVRAEGEGFYARVQPRPAVPWGLWGAAMTALLAVAGVLAAVIATDVVLAIQIVASVALFGALLLGFAHGSGYFPVEVVVDDERITWGGERFAIGMVEDCVVEGRSVRLVGAGHRTLAQIEGVDPEAGRWLALAIRASLPTGARPDRRE